MKSPLKLLILIAVIVTIAVPAGWKWGPKQKATKALTYALAPSRRERAGFEHVPGTRPSRRPTRPRRTRARLRFFFFFFFIYIYIFLRLRGHRSIWTAGPGTTRVAGRAQPLTAAEGRRARRRRAPPFPSSTQRCHGHDDCHEDQQPQRGLHHGSPPVRAAVSRVPIALTTLALNPSTRDPWGRAARSTCVRLRETNVCNGRATDWACGACGAPSAVTSTATRASRSEMRSSAVRAAARCARARLRTSLRSIACPLVENADLTSPAGLPPFGIPSSRPVRTRSSRGRRTAPSPAGVVTRRPRGDSGRATRASPRPRFRPPRSRPRIQLVRAQHPLRERPGRQARLNSSRVPGFRLRVVIQT